jgi:hypothetical protein
MRSGTAIVIRDLGMGSLDRRIGRASRCHLGAVYYVQRALTRHEGNMGTLKEMQNKALTCRLMLPTGGSQDVSAEPERRASRQPRDYSGPAMEHDASGGPVLTADVCRWTIGEVPVRVQLPMGRYSSPLFITKP